MQQLTPGSRRVNSHGQVRCAACKRFLRRMGDVRPIPSLTSSWRGCGRR